MSFDVILLVISLLLGLSVVASKISSKLGVPVLLVFLAIGMLAGSDGPGGIWFTDAALAQQIGILALAFILFSGGMDTDWPLVRKGWGPAVVLATVGVLVSAGITGWIAHKVAGLSLLEGFLLGSIVASTDAAAVFATLRSRGISLSDDLRAIVELESGSNDPTAVFLTTGLVAIIGGVSLQAGPLVGSYFWQMSVGAAAGWGIGRLGVLAMRRLRLEFDALFHVASIVIVLFAYAGVAVVGGNGFLAAYVAGITFGQGQFRQRKGLRKFHEALAWLMQIAVFLGLGLLVFPGTLPSVAPTGILIALALMFVARPLAVFISLTPFRIPIREQILVAWMGLRGAVPIILATFPLLAGLSGSQEIFNIVFFVVILSAALQGTTLAPLAKALGLHGEGNTAKEESAPFPRSPVA